MKLINNCSISPAAINKLNEAFALKSEVVPSMKDRVRDNYLLHSNLLGSWLDSDLNYRLGYSSQVLFEWLCLFKQACTFQFRGVSPSSIQAGGVVEVTTPSSTPRPAEIAVWTAKTIKSAPQTEAPEETTTFATGENAETEVTTNRYTPSASFSVHNVRSCAWIQISLISLITIFLFARQN